MRKRGAVFVVYQKLSQPQMSAEHYRNVELAWRNVEEKGFLVLANGCVLPWDHYCKESGKGATKKARNRAAEFFFGRQARKGMKPTELGWPTDEHVSHLCHDRRCCNPYHLVIEAHWRNQKRNYCGINGTCDCGQQPPCVRPYTSLKPVDDVVPGGYANQTQIETILNGTGRLYPWRWVHVDPQQAWRSEDLHGRNRKLRHDAERKHRREHDRIVQKSGVRGVTADDGSAPAKKRKTAIVLDENTVLSP